MKKTAIILALGVSAWSLMAQDQGGTSLAGERPPLGAPGMRPGFHILPPRAMAELNLTEDQKKQLADLEAEVKAKVEKILTPEQLQQLKQMRPPMGGPGGRGPSGPPPGRQGAQPPPSQDQ